MNSQDREKNQIPKGGAWYWRQADMFHALSKNKGYIAVAWDVAAGEGKKAYGLYATAEEFYEHLLQTPPDKRFGYELIPENTLCKAYADVEWIGEPDPNHTLLKRLIQFAAEWYPGILGKLEVYVACGSRPTESGAELVKHSYHITIANLVYACNHDKSMENFFTLPSTSDFSAFHWTDAKGQSKCIVDLSVYTRNRVFRLPYNMKRSSTVPLRRVGDDPHAEDYNSEFNDEDVDDVLPMVLTRIEYCADTYVVPKEVGPDKVACTQRRAPLVNTLKPTRCKTDIGLPFAKEKLQQMLQEAGDLVSIVSTVTYKNESMWMAQCTKSCPRKCLINKNRIHPHNNCLLFVKKTTKSSARIEYKCMGSECRGLMGRCLGDIHWDDLEQE